MEQKIEKVYAVTKSKDFRNVLILIIAILAMLAINSLLPLLEGSASYTEQAVEVTYKEYEDMHNKDNNYSLVHSSYNEVKELKKQLANKEITQEVLDTYSVRVYTKFFFQSTTWWLNMLTSIISIILIFYAAFNYMLSKLKRKKKEYIDLKDEVNKAVQEQVDPITYEPFNENFNLQRKIKQHVANIKYAKDKLIQRTSYKVKAGVKVKKHEAYERKIDNYNNQLSTTYIDTYVKDKKVKHFKYIYPTFVMSGYNLMGNTVDNYSLIKTDGEKLSKDGVKKIILSATLTILLAILLTFTVNASIDKPWYWVVINILAKVTPLILQVVMAYDYAESFIEEQLIVNLIARRSIILLYLASKVKPISEVNNGEQNN